MKFFSTLRAATEIGLLALYRETASNLVSTEIHELLEWKRIGSVSVQADTEQRTIFARAVHLPLSDLLPSDEQVALAARVTEALGDEVEEIHFSVIDGDDGDIIILASSAPCDAHLLALELGVVGDEIDEELEDGPEEEEEPEEELEEEEEPEEDEDEIDDELVQELTQREIANRVPSIENGQPAESEFEPEGEFPVEPEGEFPVEPEGVFEAEPESDEFPVEPEAFPSENEEPETEVAAPANGNGNVVQLAPRQPAIEVVAEKPQETPVTVSSPVAPAAPEVSEEDALGIAERYEKLLNALPENLVAEQTSDGLVILADKNGQSVEYRVVIKREKLPNTTVKIYVYYVSGAGAESMRAMNVSDILRFVQA